MESMASQSGTGKGVPTLGERIAALTALLRLDSDNQDARLQLIRAYAEAGLTDEVERETTTYTAVAKNLLNQTLELPALPERNPELELSLKEYVPGGAKAPRGAPAPRFGQDPVARRPLAELARDYSKLRADPRFFADLDIELTRFAGRPTTLLHAQRLSAHCGGARIYLKLEDTGRSDPHLMISCSGQAFVAKALGRRRLVGGVRDMRWGARMVAACARVGLEADVFVAKDLLEKQPGLAYQMRTMGARVTGVDVRNYRNGDIREAGLEAWLKDPAHTLLFTGLDGGPKPYPQIARDLTAVVGRECLRQVRGQAIRQPDVVVARSGENADALALFPPFLDDPAVRLVCAEQETVIKRRGGHHYNPYSLPLTDAEQKRVNAILEGLEYTSVARERAELKQTGRIEYPKVSLAAARRAVHDAARLEGLVVGLETAHAVAWACETAAGMSKQAAIAVLLAEKPGKDIWDDARTDGAGKANGDSYEPR